MKEISPQASDKKILLIFIGVSMFVLFLLTLTSIVLFNHYKKSNQPLANLKYVEEPEATVPPKSFDEAIMNFIKRLTNSGNVTVNFATSSSTSTNSNSVTKSYSNCTFFVIDGDVYEPAFESRYCYQQQDLSDLAYTLQIYKGYQTAIATTDEMIEMYCPGENEAQKSACASVTASKSNSQRELAKVKLKVLTLISKGQR